MQHQGLLASIPIWGVFMATLLFILLSVECGYQWARKKRRAEVEKEAPVGVMVGAVLGLLAFILAFTFGMAAERYHDRQLALLDEANAIAPRAEPYSWRLLGALFVIAILSLAAMGYHSGVAGTNRSPVTLAVAIAFSVVILLIVDLDRPGEGFINVSQQVMIDLQDWMPRSQP